MYNIYGFLEKNKDTLFQDFKRLLYSSKNPIIRAMWPEGALDIKSVSLGLSILVSTLDILNSIDLYRSSKQAQKCYILIGFCHPYFCR